MGRLVHEQLLCAVERSAQRPVDMAARALHLPPVLPALSSSVSPRSTASPSRSHLVDRAVRPAHAIWAELLPHARRPRNALLQRRIVLLLLLLGSRRCCALLRWQLDRHNG